MNQNRILLAIFLTILVTLIWSSQQPKPKKPAKPETPAVENGSKDGETDTSTETGESGEESTETTPVEDVVDVEPFEGELVLQNDKLRIRFDQQSGAVDSVWLLDHWSDVEDKGEPGWENKFRFIRTYKGGARALDLNEDGVADDREGWLNRRLWDTEGPSADGQSLSFSAEFDDVDGRRYRLVREYALTSGGGSRLAFKLRLEQVSGAPGRLIKLFRLSTSGGTFPIERANGTSGYGKLLSRVQIGGGSYADFDLTTFSANDLLGEDAPKGVVPGGFLACDMGVYFGAYLRPVTETNRREVHAKVVDPFTPRGIAKPTLEQLEEVGPIRAYSQLGLQLEVGLDGGSDEVGFDWYVGPKDHRSIKDNFDENDAVREAYLDVADAELTAQSSFCCVMDTLGPIIQAISKAVVWLISYFTTTFGSAGIGIIVLTIFMRIMMFPITRKSQVSMQKHAKKMAKIKPKLEKLKEKYKDDQQKFAAEQMKLMKEEGVSLVPLGGCLPLFLQMPIFFGLFAAIRFDYELRHAAFLWCDDLSMPDTVIPIDPIDISSFCCIPMPGGGSIDGLNIFPLLMIAAMFFQQLLMPKSPDPQMRQQQKMMMFMPLFFGVLMYGYAAGLSVYWLSSSFFGIFEQLVIKRVFPIDKEQAAEDRQKRLEKKQAKKNS